MFGQPGWFRKKSIGWGLTPITWQGWIYALAWGGVIALPFVLLITRQQVPEAIIWMVCSMGMLVWDARKIVQAIEREERKNMLFIGDEEENEPVETQGFDLQVRD